MSYLGIILLYNMRDAVSNTVCGQGRFLFFDTKFDQYTRLAVFGYLLYNTYVMNNNSCLSERLTDIIKILGEPLKSNGTLFQGRLWAK